MMPLVLIHLYAGVRSAVMSVPAGVVARITLACLTMRITRKREIVHFHEIGAHAFQHDVLFDVDHVRVADIAAVDHVATSACGF